MNDGSRTRLISRNLKDLTADYAHIAAAASRVTAKASTQRLVLRQMWRLIPPSARHDIQR